jgi:hypothetical protein
MSFQLAILLGKASWKLAPLVNPHLPLALLPPSILRRSLDGVDIGIAGSSAE